MKIADIYSYMIANWLNGGRFITRRRMLATDIKPEYNAIFTKGYIKRIFRITGIKPENVDRSYVDYIRAQMFDLHPDVEVMISIQNWPTKINVTNDKFSREMARASDKYSTYKNVFESQSGLDRLAGKTYRMPGGAKIRVTKENLSEHKQLFVSYLELFDHINSGGTTALTEVFIELVCKDHNELNEASDTLYGVINPLNMGLTEVKGLNKTYLRECGLSMHMPNKLHKKFLPQLLFTDKNAAAFSSYKSRGLVGSTGVLLGMDYRSALPFSIDIFRSASAQVFLLMGKTGAGKTYAAFQFAMSALALGEYVTAIDIKGREWSRLSNLVKTKILTFDARNPSFVNTLRLNDIKVDSSNAQELFSTAVSGTVNLLSLVVNLQEGDGNPSDLQLVLREAVMKLYSIRSVSPDNPKSFENTEGMRYSDILPILDDLSSTKTYTEDQRKMILVARSRCHAYLSDSGIFADAFRNEVTLNDVMEAPLVIYEFNKNQNAMTDSLDVLRIFMVQFLDSKKKAMLREKNKFLFCFYEELQRCDQFGNLLEYICADVTGSRSNNAVVVLLLNSLKVLQGERARDIRSNITSFMCGSVEDNDIRAIEDDFGRPWLASQLKLFSDRQNDFRKCFAADIDTGNETVQAVYKVMLPDYLSEQFKTRTTLE